MKRYMLFGGSFYYPSGGIGDLVMSSDELDELMKRAIDNQLDWWHIYDCKKQEQVISWKD